MQTKATVLSLDGEFATVESIRTSACEGCHKSADGGCSVCSLLGTGQKMRAKARNAVGAMPGDEVLIESDTGRMLGYAALLFLLPPVMAIVLYGILAGWGGVTMGWQIGGALIGFFLSLGGVMLYSARVQKKRCDIEIVRILPPKEALGADPENLAE